MQTLTTLADLRRARQPLTGTFGLVPTMGFLHAGHLSLVKLARAECDHVGVSIFVNPTQFGPNEDLSAYPRDLARDLGLLEPLGVDLVWTPTPEEMYPDGFQTWVNVEQVTAPLEGKHRPGHFRGVTTVVAKLFNAFTPQRAYFGQKDAQQVVVIRRMVRDLNFPVEIVVGPIVREPDGLALSSRNVYLSPPERQAATVLHRALQRGRRRPCRRRARRRRPARDPIVHAGQRAAGARGIRVGRRPGNAGRAGTGDARGAAVDGGARRQDAAD